MKQPFVIGIAGGSGSGKSTLAEAIANTLPGRTSILRHDSYYRDRSRLPINERGEVNFDALEAIETPLFVEHLKQLIDGDPIVAPRYDFSTHTREATGDEIAPGNVVVVEGIMIFAEPTIRELLDLRVFIDIDSDERFIRRLNRDVSERGRTVESVVSQYSQMVKPFQDTIVDPSREFADIAVTTQNFERVMAAIRRLSVR